MTRAGIEPQSPGPLSGLIIRRLMSPEREMLTKHERFLLLSMHASCGALCVNLTLFHFLTPWRFCLKTVSSSKRSKNCFYCPAP